MKFLCRNLIWIMIKIKLVFLVLVLGFSSLNAKVWSQQDRIDLVFENMNMVQLFEQIQQKTNLKFVFNHEDVQKYTVSGKVHYKTVSEILDLVFADKPLRYEITSDHVVIFYAKQNDDEKKVTGIKVKGTVTDEEGIPLPGVTVMIKWTSIGTATDIDGKFHLDVPQSDTTKLVFSFVGMQSYELKISKKKTEYNVVMKPDTKALDDVVVTGFFTKKKESFTGSVKTMTVEEIKAVSNTNLVSAISMLTPGMRMVENNAFGSNPNRMPEIVIRGTSSLSTEADQSANQPVIMLDGVEITMRDLYDIDINDIERVDVLKDASATAIYGSRASNGVIIINTKKGKSGRVQVGYSGTFSINTRPNKVDVMSANEFREFVTSKFGESSAQFKALGQANTDWQDEIFKTSFSTDHNVNVSGAIPHMPYRVSVSYTNENGILKTSNMERLTGAISLNPNFFDKKLNIQLNVKGIYNTNRFADTGAIGMATQYDPTQPIYMDGNPYGNGYFMYMKSGNNPTPVDIGLANPVSILDSKHDESTVYRSIGNAQIDYKFHFLPELRANLNLGYDVSKSEGDVIIEDNAPMTWCQGNYKTGFGENSSYYQLKRNTLLDFYLNYAKEFGAHHVDVMGGYSWQHFYNSTWTKYPYSTVKAEETGKEFYKDMEDYSTENYLVSFFGRLNYTLLNRYLVTFTLRNDGSSRFNKDNRWGLFPSVALAWKMKEENFLKGVDWLSDLKLRLGYGITGQQNLNNGDYPYMARYMYSKAGANYYFGNNKYSLIAPQAYDENLKWEETTTYNIGLDFGVLNNKLTGTLDLYYRKTDDLLNTVTAPAGTNFSNQLLTNVGTLENKGIELTLTAHPITTKDWDWTLSYNISYNKNEITKLTFNDDPAYKGVIHTGIDGATGYNIMINAVDHPYNSFYVWEQLYDKAGNPIEGAYVDQNGDNKIDEEDLVAYKKSAPDVFMGLTSQLSYKNWDLSFALRASIGNYAYNNVQSNREAWDGSQMYDQTGFLKNRLTSAWKTNFKTGQYRSSYYVQNASFVRMDNISLGYTFNKLFNDKQSARVYVTVQNPFVITKYDGLDPEISGSGVDNNIYPRPRVFMLGLNLNF